MIIYFSSTGNTLTVARDLAVKLDESVMHINQALRLKRNKDKTVGLIFPVHNNDMPYLIQKFVHEFDFGDPDYIFSIITHGGDKGNSHLTFKKLLERKGQILSYYNDVLMPVNSRIMYGMITDKIKERIEESIKKVNIITRDIERKVENVDNLRKKHLVAIMHKISNTSVVKKYFTPTINQDQCISCGICAKVCPVNNIIINESGAFINDGCENCLTCMHWCPDVAIGFGKRQVKKKQQYHHPDIQLKEIISQLK